MNGGFACHFFLFILLLLIGDLLKVFKTINARDRVLLRHESVTKRLKQDLNTDFHKFDKILRSKTLTFLNLYQIFARIFPN